MSSLAVVALLVVAVSDTSHAALSFQDFALSILKQVLPADSSIDTVNVVVIDDDSLLDGSLNIMTRQLSQEANLEMWISFQVEDVTKVASGVKPDGLLNLVLTSGPDLVLLLENDNAEKNKALWLMEDSKQNRDAILQAGTSFKSKIFLAEVSDGSTGFTISEAYSMARNLTSEFHVISSAEEAFSEELIWARRGSALKSANVVWHVGFVPYNPMLFFNEETQTLTGFNAEVWHSVTQDLNVTSIMVKSESFGKLEEDGKWGGVVGKLQAGQTDISLTSMSTTYSRSLVIDYLMPVTEVHYVLATYLQEEVAGGTLNTFETSTYLAQFGLVTLSCVLASVILWCTNGWLTDIGEIFVITIGSYIGQGLEGSTHLSGISRKVNMVLFYTHFLFEIIVVAVFSARLTSTLAVRNSVPIVTSMEDVDSLDLNLYINGGGSTENGFSSAPMGSVHKRIWENQLGTNEKFRPRGNNALFNGFSDDERGVVFTPQFRLLSFIKEKPETTCKLFIHTAEKRLFSMGARPGFEYLPLVNHQLKKARENGVLDQLVKRHLTPTTNTREYICSKGDELSSITFTNVQALFVLVGTGVAASLLLLTAEKVALLWWNKKCETQTEPISLK